MVASKVAEPALFDGKFAFPNLLEGPTAFSEIERKGGVAKP